MKICQRCNTVYEDEFSFCQKCGFELEKIVEKQFCVHCGKEFQSEGSFCPYCGHSIANTENDKALTSKPVTTNNLKKIITREEKDTNDDIKKMYCPNCGCEVEVMAGCLCYYCATYLGPTPITGTSAAAREAYYNKVFEKKDGWTTVLAIVVYIIILYFVVKA